RVVAHQCREIERYREAGLAVLKQELVAPVGILGGPEPRELAHGPQPAAVHGVVDAAGERIAPRRPELPRGVEVREIVGCVDRLPLDTAHGVTPPFTWSRISAATP